MRETTIAELQGVQEIQRMNKEYLNKNKASLLVHKFLEESSSNEDLLVRFLRGRKGRPKHAWETLKRYAEVRFNEYPEVFPETFSEELEALKVNPVVGILKSRDSLGRRIMFFDTAAWNPDECSLATLTVACAAFAEKLLLDEDGLNNGFVFIQNCSGIRIRHVQEYSLRAIRRLINIFVFAFPLKLKLIYYVNVPSIFTYAFAMARPFLTKKIRERLNMIGAVKDYQDIYQSVPLDVLPKCLGGTLEIEDAVDYSFLEF